MKNRFWREQPVFHYYDLGYYIFPPGLIDSALPKVNKYCNLKDITVSSSITSSPKITQFIKQHYLQDGENSFNPAPHNIIPYFEGHNQSCFFSTYLKPDMLVEDKTKRVITSEKIVGIMTTRPLNVNMNGANFSVYYSDYLCVAEDFRKQGIAPQLIQTHEYIQRHLNKKIQISLFKREGENTTAGIVPLAKYNTIIYDMKAWRTPEPFPPFISLLDCNEKNIQVLVEFLKESTPKFKMTCLPEIGNILSLLKSKNIFIYMIRKKERILAAYFFKKSCTTLEKGREILICSASISLCENAEFFFGGFLLAVVGIKKEHPCFQYIGIECCSDNVILQRFLVKRYVKTMSTGVAYFWYNFAYPTFDSDKILILN